MGGMSRMLTNGEFIGRSAELERFAGLRKEVAAGTPLAVLVGGDAGVGKTRLLGQVIDAARTDHFQVLLGRCIYLGGEVMPYAPIIEILRSLAPAGGLPVPPTETELLRLVPSLTPDLPVPERSPHPSRLFEQMLTLLCRLAEERPVLLAVEDLHWADESTRAMLSFLLRHLRACPVLVVGTYRTDELHRRHPLWRWLSELDRGVRPDRLELMPFNRPELHRMLASLAGGQIEPDTVAEIHDRSGGNAFYAEELLAASASGPGRIAASLREVVHGRLADLNEDTQRLLRLAAASRRVDLATLAHIGRQPVPDVEAALRQLVDQGVLVTIGGELEFRHELVREVLYDDLLPGERTRIHREIADALAHSAQPEDALAGELAHHWQAAGVPANALPASVRAARHAVAMAADAEACAHCERALELWEQVTGPARAAGMSRMDLLLLYADAAYMNRTPRRAIELLRAELPQRARGEPVGALHKQLFMCMLAITHPQTSAVAEQAAARIGDDTATAERSSLLDVAARGATLTGRYDEAQRLAWAGAAAAREAGDEAQEVGSLIPYARALVTQGRAEGIAVLNELVARAARINADLEYRVVGRLAAGLNEIGSPAEGLSWCEAGLRRPGLREFTLFSLRVIRLDSLRRLGAWDEVAAALDALDLELRNPVRVAGPVGPALADRGDLDRAEALVAAQWDGLCDTSIFMHLVPSGAVAAALVAIHRHRPGDAYRFVARALELTAPNSWLQCPELVAFGVRAEADRADAARVARDPDAVEDALTRSSALLAYLEPALADGRVDIERSRIVMRLWADQARAEQERAHGRPTPDTWEGLARRWTELSIRPEQAAYCHYRSAESLLLTHPTDHSRARSAAGAAVEIATRLGARPLLAAIEELATRGRLGNGQAPAPAVAATPFGLTGREYEVLALLAKGYTYQQIGRELFISAKTVGTHVSRILAKLHVDSRNEAARAYHRHRRLNGDQMLE